MAKTKQVLCGIIIFITLLFLIETSFHILNIPKIDFCLHILEQGQGYSYRNRKNLDVVVPDTSIAVKTNSMGFRGNDIAAKKPSGIIRVACLGDSTTFGYGLNAEQAYSHILGANLGEQYQVINCGTIGQDSRYGLISFKEGVLPLQPDIAVFSYGLNDSSTEDYPTCNLSRIGKHIRNFLFPKSRLCRFVFKCIYQMKVKAYEAKNRDGDKPLVEIAAYKHNLIDFIRISHEHDIRPILFFAPIMSNTLRRKDALRYYEIMKTVCMEYNVPLIDVIDVFAKDGLLFVDAYHPNKKGHNIIADEIAKVIQANRTK